MAYGGRRVRVAVFGEGLATHPVPGLHYLPADDESESAADIPFVDAFDGNGLVAFVSDDLDNRQLDERLIAARSQNPNWTVAWFDGSGAATGIELSRRKRQPKADGAPLDGDSAILWAGSTTSRTRLGIGDELGVTFERRTSVTLERIADGSDAVVPKPAIILRFETSGPFDLPGGQATTTGPVTVGLVTDVPEKPGTLRFDAELPESCTARIHLGGGAGRRSATAFAVPAGPGSIRFDPATPFDGGTSIGLAEGRTVDTGWGDRARRPIALETIAGSAVVPQPDGNGSLYLAPSGPFRSVAARDLVCGLAGAEYLRIGDGSILRFVPDRPSGPSGSADDRESRTAWLSIGEETEPIPYFAQSKTNGFHTDQTNFLPYADISATVLTSSTAIPTMPWLGFASAADGAAQLESGLAERRFELLLGSETEPETQADSAATAEAAPNETHVVTPSGLRATVADGAITQLGVMKVGNDPMTIDAIRTPSLRAALSADEQLIVMSRPPVFTGGIVGDYEIEIAGWTFGFGPDRWADNGTTMIIKQRIDRPLGALLTDRTTWTKADSFNLDPDRTASRLGRWLDEVADSDDPAKADLHERVLADPTWLGVLFISIPVPRSGLPDGLQMLPISNRGDGESGLLLAHHLTVDRRPVAPEAGDSSVSGLLEYPQPGHAPAPGVRADGHEFTFTSLRVRFVESAVAEFGAEVEVSLGSFLHTALDEPSTIVLRGEQERRAGATHYCFATELSPARSLPITDATIADVHIDKADLTSESSALRLSFDGDIEFAPPTDPVDLLGYRELSFRDVDLLLQTDGGTAPPRFEWNADRSRLTGEPEPSSLPAQFPLRPVGLLLGEDDQLASLGFQPVQLPTNDIAALGPRFAGIDFELDLGSMGGLSAVPGFVANMALFWSPDRKRQRRQLGLRFPGVDVGAHGFSLQDIFDIACHGLALKTRREPAGDGSTREDAFVLHMNGLGLNVFGFEIPWSGTINAQLAPDPAGSKALGWIGGYANPRDSTENERQLPRSGNRVR